MNRADLHALLNEKFLSGGRRTTAQFARDFLNESIDSFLNPEDFFTSDAGHYVAGNGSIQPVLTYTASNGITKTGNNIALGGPLTGNTDIDGLYNLRLGANAALNNFAVTTLTQALMRSVAADSSESSSITTVPSELDLTYSGNSILATIGLSAAGIQIFYDDPSFKTSLNIDPNGVGIATNASGYLAYLKADNLTATNALQAPDSSGTLLISGGYNVLTAATAVDGAYNFQFGNTTKLTGFRVNVDGSDQIIFSANDGTQYSQIYANTGSGYGLQYNNSGTGINTNLYGGSSGFQLSYFDGTNSHNFVANSSGFGFSNDLTIYGYIKPDLLTASHTYQLPNGSGTFALFSDITVSSVFGRTGVVTAQANDYTFAQLSSKPTTVSGYGITDITAQALTGLNVTGSSISATDSILIAFGKVQNQINGVLGGAIYSGTFNATTNTPTIADGTGTKGHYYVVSVAGVLNPGSGSIDFQVGDWAIYNGTIWQKVDNTDAVSSVNGFIGAVNLTTANISEVTNLYYTNARAIAATLTGYTSGAGTISSSDSTLTAIQKLNGNISAIVSGVSSVFGRTGAVTATSGDYTFAQIGSKPTTVAGYGITDAITGTGSTGQISYWSGTSTQAGNAGFIFDATNGFVGIGGTTPAARLHLSGNVSAPAWATSGQGLRYQASTYTDTTSSGTVSTTVSAVHSIMAPIIAASSLTTFTGRFATLYIESPTNGPNVTLNNIVAIYAAGNIESTGKLIATDIGSTTGLSVRSGTSIRTAYTTTGLQTHTTDPLTTGTTAQWAVTQSNHSGGAQQIMLVTAGALTSQTTATSIADINLNLSAVMKVVDGTTPVMRGMLLTGRTYTPQTSALTVTVASVLDVIQSIAGSGTTITNNYAQTWRFDTSNYMGVSIGSTGDATFTNTGSSGRFIFSNQLIGLGAITSGSTPGSALLFVSANLATNNSTSQAELLFAGASTVFSRIWSRSSANVLPTANSSYATVTIGTQLATIAGTGTHALFANMVINPITVTAGAGALTASASLFVNGGTSGATKNYALLLGAGTATSGPLGFTSGTNLTTAIAGVMEYNGTNLFFTRTGTTRENVLVGNDGAAAPGTNLLTAFVNYYGASMTNALGTPNSWASVVIAGTTYKLPLYT